MLPPLSCLVPVQSIPATWRRSKHFAHCALLWLLIGTTSPLGAAETLITLEDAQVTVDASGTSQLPFTIRREGELADGVRVQVETREGGANPAAPGEDYTPVLPAEVILHPGQESATVEVEVFGLPADTPDQTLLLDLLHARAFNSHPRLAPVARNYPVLGVLPGDLVITDLNGNRHSDMVTGNDYSLNVSVLLSDAAGGFDTAAVYSVDPVVEPILHNILIATGDVTGNGHPDIVAGGFDPFSIRLFPGDGSGVFAAPLHIALSENAASYPSAIALADLDNDGRMDIITAFDADDPNISILFGDGKGGFADVETIPVDQVANALAVTDITGNGYLDIIAGNSTNISILAGDGAGGFAATASFSAGPGVSLISSVAVADVTGNGHPDLVTANRHSANPPHPPYTHGSVSMLAGDGSGEFGPAVQFELEQGVLMAAAVADMTGNGHADIVFIRRDDRNQTTDSVNLMAGLGGGEFVASIKLHATGGSPGALALADVTGDHIRDVVTVNTGSGNVSILPGDGAGNIGFPGNFDTGDRPYAVVTADLNGNGLADIVTANNTASNVSVLINDGADGFALESHPLPIGAHPSWIEVGDVNNNGIPDLITANFTANTVSILLGDGDGGFAEAAHFAAGLAPYRIALGDVNGNGHLDIVAINTSANGDGISLLLGDGTGGFDTPIQLGVGPDFHIHDPRWVTLADVTGNGHLDILTANAQVNNVSVLSGDGKGGFTHTAYLQPGESPVAVATGDITGDGNLDLVVLNHRSQSISVFYGDGEGDFSDAEAFPIFPGAPGGISCEQNGICPWAWGMVLADITGNGHLDVATANTDNDTLAVLANDGSGRFPTFETFDTATAPRAVAVADITGDGNQDVITAINGNRLVSILTNELSRVQPTNTQATGTIIYGDSVIFSDRFEQNTP